MRCLPFDGANQFGLTGCGTTSPFNVDFVWTTRLDETSATGAGDPNRKYLNHPHIAYVIPKDLIDQGSVRQVSFRGTNTGAAFERLFSMTTALETVRQRLPKALRS